MDTGSQGQQPRVSAGDLKASAERIRQGLDTVDALLAEAEELVKRLPKKRRSKSLEPTKTLSDQT